MALDKVVNGRNDKGAKWHWPNRERVNWQKGKMVSGRKNDWARWQWGKMVKAKMGRGRNGKGEIGRKVGRNENGQDGIGQSGKTQLECKQGQLQQFF